MKTEPKFRGAPDRIAQHSRFSRWRKCLAGLSLAALTTIAWQAHGAVNLLNNGNFNGALAGSWNVWTWGGGWAGQSTTAAEQYDGTAFVYMGASDGGAGMYQELFAQPDVPYTLSSVSSVDDWWWPVAEMRLIFLDANNATLLTAATNCAAGITAYDTGLGWSNYTFTVTSPPGTVKVKVEFACPNGHGTVRFDNAVLTAPLVYPEISNMTPDGTTLMQAANAFSFRASSTAAAINNEGIQLTVNGTDVSSSLAITGTASSKDVVYSGITTNKSYQVSITVTDASGLITTKSLRFDTFSPDYYTWEAEDFNYNGGSFIDNPQTNSYAELLGVPDIDYSATTTAETQHAYRPWDLVGIESTTDLLRRQYAGTNDYSVGWFDGGEWLNFTRNFPSGLFNVYARMASPSSSTLNLSRVTSGETTTSQTLAPIGNFEMSGGLGWSTYSWVPLTDASGNMVKLSLGGLATLRATSGGNANAQFFMLVPANTNLPAITDLYPSGATLFQGTNTLAFKVSSQAGINASGIRVTLSVTNPLVAFTTNLTSTNGLTITGTANNRVVTYSGLLLNSLYNAVISVTDAANNSVTLSPRFDTFAPIAVWEAEDWDHSGGQYINNPGVNAYYNYAGFEGVDYHDINAQGGRPYRPGDTMSADVILDTPRAEYAAANGTNYAVGYFAQGEWVNYTRSFPAGTYNVYGRFAAGGDASIESVGIVTNGAGTTTQLVRPVGQFNIASTGGWGTYRWTALRDAYGNLAQVALNGLTTLKIQHTGGADANNALFMIIPAETTLPRITDVTPIGWRQSTNTLRFVASSTAGIADTNIAVTLNGVPVTNLNITGSVNSWVVTAKLAPNTMYAAVITVKDINNLTARNTVSFDTFSATAYAWEAEDFDYNNGKFFDVPQVNSYAALPLDAVEGVDYHDTANGGAAAYRATTLSTAATGDLARPQFDGINTFDYRIGYTATGEWANYTRTYPAGAYNVYMRGARGTGGNGVMGLQKVTSGWGTATQTTAPLGTFTIPNTGAWETYTWVPLNGADGKPAVVRLSGQTTLRLTDGGGNVNFLVLAPALGLSSKAVGANLELSYGTQPGFNYSLLYKDSLTDSSWSTLSTVAGDGSTRTVTQPMTGQSRFYMLEVH